MVIGLVLHLTDLETATGFQEVGELTDVGKIYGVVGFIGFCFTLAITSITSLRDFGLVFVDGQLLVFRKFQPVTQDVCHYVVVVWVASFTRLGVLVPQAHTCRHTMRTLALWQRVDVVVALFDVSLCRAVFECGGQTLAQLNAVQLIQAVAVV